MSRIALFAIATIVLALWALWAFQPSVLPWLGYKWPPGTTSQWSDTFGALNALFAALAFVAVLGTLWTQRQELASQQKQIDEGLAEQHRQRFEGHFFQLLGLLRDLRKEVKFERRAPKAMVSGPDALKAAYNSFAHQLGIATMHDREPDESKIASLYEEAVHMDSENELGPYFRIIYTILRRISEDRLLSASEKISYGNLIRSQLSSSEIALVGLNGLTDASNDFRAYILEFKLLKYLPNTPIRSHLERFYPTKAFEARD